MRFRMPFGARAAFTAVLAFLTFAPAAMAVDEVNTKKLRKDVTVNGILAHERALQRIANKNGGTRASGTPGYDASVAYVQGPPEEGRLQGVRADVRLPVLPRRWLRRSCRRSRRPRRTTRPATYDYSGSGDVTGRRSRRSTSWSRRPRPPSSTQRLRGRATSPRRAATRRVALIQRGTCDFAVKATNAQAAGYDAVIIFNEGQPGRTELFAGHARRARRHDPGASALSFADGAELVRDHPGRRR